jgi:hypothetical protein
MKKSKLIEVLNFPYNELSSLSPDQIYKKTNQNYQIDVKEIEEIIENDLLLATEIMNKHSKWHFDIQDPYIWLRRILEQQDEFTEKNSSFKRIFAHICISKNVFLHLIHFVNNLLMRFSKLTQGTREYYQQYVKIENTLQHLVKLADEYQKYLENIEEESTGYRRAWHVRLPEPDKIIALVTDAFIYIKEGALSFPLLRSYIEIKLQIILENTINQKLKEVKNTSEYKNKEIIFIRNMEFADLLDLTEIFKMIDLRDKDILNRFHDVSSKAIHIGSFSDQIIAWHLLFYLDKLDVRAGSSFESLLTKIEELKKNRKLEVIPEGHKLRNYSRFQSTSNQRT